ncbi:PspC domain-containing protein [Maribacter algarum]|uniref:PspC domain-containing protein n=1 Tax=Maribacter algarum (ex Zhang et al. 2020) TaxID=2578118 RepID=A0A5S3PPW6_9FLAO|nr:PspC domain-containing protein [Maribacter algarum]TMM56787.1 PspC domain-containing protein [Maribacter algarum]
MNKTVNINLANILFHIDEGAFNKMRLYLESIRRSFANTPGSDEILADIEARIAELFHEKLENERQVITDKEVDEVITIMGQPEDYMVDEDIFEDEPKAKRSSVQRRSKKLYRDTEMKYVAGVSSGLAHYVGVDPLWVRLLWIVLTIGSGGGFILLYGLLWILIPEATTTSQKLDMRGEDINISNIERKVKEGFDDVAEKVKNVDYSEVGNKVKNGGKTFFDTIGDIIMFFFKIFGKFIGIILIIVGAATIIGMFIGMLTLGTLDWFHLPGLDGVLNNLTGTPIWLVSLLIFFAIGIPFFFLLYLGLKILVNNLKSIGNIAKFSLLGLWLISLISLIVMGVREAASHAFTGSITQESELFLENQSDPLNIQLAATELWDQQKQMRVNDMVMVYDNDGTPVLLSDDVRFNLKKSQDSTIRISIRKEANGPSYDDARSTAEKIEYSYSLNGNNLVLNDFLTTSDKSRFNDQEIRVNLYLPVGTTIKYTPSSSRNWVVRSERNRGDVELDEAVWKMGFDGELKCQECPEKDDDENDEEDNKIIINEDGIDIDIKDGEESFKMKIGEDGIDIKAKDENEENENLDIEINEDGVKLKAKDNDNF